MCEDTILESFVPGSKKDKHQLILEELQIMDIDDDSTNIQQPEPASNFLPSKFLKTKKKNKIEVPEQTEDEWLAALLDTSDVKIKRGKRSDIFEDAINGKKKKKKKDKKGDEPTDYKKEFETDAALLRNLMVDQSHFVESLQKEYNFLKSSKSSSRGVTKNMTDLIDNINSARTLTMQLIEKQIGLKKTIADLTLKERKEFSNSFGDGENLSDFASTYLKQMISERQQVLNGGSTEVGNYTEDEMASMVDSNLIGDDVEERDPEAQKHLDYENRNVSIWIYIDSNDEDNYEFVAIDEDGEEIPDYPLPYKDKLSINRSTNVATDTLGRKYNIRWT